MKREYVLGICRVRSKVRKRARKKLRTFGRVPKMRAQLRPWSFR
jgi:hypothetical protein